MTQLIQMCMLTAGALMVMFCGVRAALISKTTVFHAGCVAIVPVALQIGTPPGLVVAFSSACYGYYILPTYPSDLAALQFDRSGTTHIGRFVINHSFIVPGLIGVLTATAMGWVFGKLYGYI